MEGNNINTRLIGTGVLFPIQLGTNEKGETGWYPVNGDPALIENNLASLFQYLIGQRFRQEDFGTRLWECLEEPSTESLGFLVRTFVKDAISNYEDRIQYKSSNVQIVGSTLKMLIEYTIVDTSNTGTVELSYDSQTNTLNL